MMRKDWVYRKGDIYYADLRPVKGSEQGGSRPVIVIQNNTGNRYSPTLIVAIVTTKVNKKTNFPTHHLIDKNQAFSQPSEVMLEQIRTIDKCRIDRYLGKVSVEDMCAIDDALLISLALEYVKETKAVSSNCDGLSPKL